MFTVIQQEMQKPEPKLMHMPEHLKQLITDRTPDVRTKLAVSQMSKGFQSRVVGSPITYEEVNVKVRPLEEKVTVTIKETVREPYIVEHYTNLVMEFTAHENGVLQRNPSSNWEKVLPEKDYRKAAVQYLLGLMRPKAKTGKLSLEWDRMQGFERSWLDDFFWRYPKRKFEEDRKVIMDEIEQGLQAKQNQLLVGKITTRFRTTTAHILQILPYLQPGTLTEIEVDEAFESGFRKPKLTSLDQIFETEQWKQAKCIFLSNYDCDISFEQWAHFTTVKIYRHRPIMTAKNFLETFLNRPQFDQLTVFCSGRFDRTGLSDYVAQLNLESQSNNDDIKSIIRMPDEPLTRIRATINEHGIWLRRSNLDFSKPLLA